MGVDGVELIPVLGTASDVSSTAVGVELNHVRGSYQVPPRRRVCLAICV